MKAFEVIFFETENGEKPVETFMQSLDAKHETKLIGLLEVLEEKGNELRSPYSKHLDDGIFEIRCQYGNNAARVLYFFYYQRKIVLTNGFIKKTQKLPRREMELAKIRRKLYVERMSEK